MRIQHIFNIISRFSRKISERGKERFFFKFYFSFAVDKEEIKAAPVWIATMFSDEQKKRVTFLKVTRFLEIIL